MNGPRATAADDRFADDPSAVTPEIAAEAAVWVARLHGPDRSRRMEGECLDWQGRSAAHREAFERCTQTWQDVPRVTVASAFESTSSGWRQAGERSTGRRAVLVRWASALTVAGLLFVGAEFVQRWTADGVYSTGVGEQQLVVLGDGTRMLLNTDTHVRVGLESVQRTVDVRSGEAIFEVAKDPRRPFVVRVASSEVVALGTTFSVRFTDPGARDREKDELAVTLIEGRVTVRPAADGARSGLAPSVPTQLQAGERLQISKSTRSAAANSAAHIDRPNVEQLLAWKRSEVVFEDMSLAEAVAEMNRYSRTPVVLLDGLRSTDLRVSGLYRTGDSAGFARAVAALHGLAVHEGQGRLELSKAQ